MRVLLNSMQITEIIELLENNVSSESINYVVRMRATGDNYVERVKPVIIVKFKAEIDNYWQFLKNKSDLKEIDKFGSVF